MAVMTLNLDSWEQHANYICRGSALTNAKNQALRVLALIAEVRRLQQQIADLRSVLDNIEKAS